MQLTYLGHSCVLLSGTKKVLIDPFIEGGSVAGTDPDIIAVTHGHTDHMGETVSLARKTVAITEIAKFLKSKGIPAEGMNIGGTLTVDGVTFTMTPALHSSTIEEGGIPMTGGAAAGFVIGMDNRTVYHAGDTALFSDMKLDRRTLPPGCRPAPDRGKVHDGGGGSDDGGEFHRRETGDSDPLQYLGQDCS